MLTNVDAGTDGALTMQEERKTDRQSRTVTANGTTNSQYKSSNYTYLGNHTITCTLSCSCIATANLEVTFIRHYK